MTVREKKASYSLPPRLINISNTLERDGEQIHEHLAGRFDESNGEIALLESTLRDKDLKITQLTTTLRQREFEQINQDAKLITLTQKLNYKEKRIQSLENELTLIHGARFWKCLLFYAKLKSLFRTNPRVAIKRTSQKIQMDGLFATLMQGGTYLLGKSRTNTLHNPLKLPLPDDYEAYLSAHQPCLQQLLSQRQEILEWKDRPLISLIIPVYNTRIKWLKDLLSSISSQTYDRWETILVDDRSTSFQTVVLLREQAQKDPRFKLIERSENGGVAAACQEGLEATSGLFVAVVDHDDVLEPDALYHVVSKLRTETNVDVVYSDEILMDVNGKVKQAVFRPDYSYHRLLSHPYIVHLTVFRRTLALQVGGFDRSYETSQDYDLLLRLAAATDHFAHIPRVLYRWRQHAESMGHQKITKTMGSSIRALQNHLKLKNEPESIVKPGLSYNFFRVHRPIRKALVSIIIPTRDRVDLLKRCVTSLQKKTRTPHNVQYELIIADNGSTAGETHLYFRELEKNGHRVVNCEGPFNFSRINNMAVRHSRGNILLFLNNDMEIVNTEWLTALLEHSQRPEIGAVGAKLLYPDGLIQHAGVILGINGCAGHSHQFFSENEHWRPCGGHLDELLCVRECAAVTAACMMVRREVFEKAGAFDEDFAVGFGDTDLCLRILKAGYANLWTPYARLIHYESASRGKRDDDLHLHPEDVIRFKNRWKEVLETGDPYYNPCLSLDSNNFLPKS